MLFTIQSLPSLFKCSSCQVRCLLSVDILWAHSWLEADTILCNLLSYSFTSVFTYDWGGKSYLWGASSKIRFVLIVLCVKSFRERSPFFASFLLMSLVPPRNMIKSSFVRFPALTCIGDVIASMSAFGFVVPKTLKESSRQLLIFYDRPLT